MKYSIRQDIASMDRIARIDVGAKMAAVTGAIAGKLGEAPMGL